MKLAILTAAALALAAPAWAQTKVCCTTDRALCLSPCPVTNTVGAKDDEAVTKADTYQLCPGYNDKGEPTLMRCSDALTKGDIDRLERKLDWLMKCVRNKADFDAAPKTPDEPKLVWIGCGEPPK